MDTRTSDTHDDSATAASSRRGWWLSLYPRLSARARRRLVIALAVATLAAQPVAAVRGQREGRADPNGRAPDAHTRPAQQAPRSDGAWAPAPPAPASAPAHDPHGQPAVRQALQALGLSAPAEPQRLAAPAALNAAAGAGAWWRSRAGRRGADG